MRYLVQVQEIIYSYLNNEPMEIVLGTFMIFLAIAVVSAICFFLSLLIYKALRAKALWLFVPYVLLFSIIYILINRYGLYISFDTMGMILILAGVMIAAGSAFLVSRSFYEASVRKQHSSAGTRRFFCFVLSFYCILTIM